MITIIVAMAANRVIGAHGGLPWKLPDDMARFKRLTMGYPVVMGRATFESMGKPLAGRRNIVLTRTRGFTIDGCEVVGSREEAMERVGAADTVFIIGGARVYELFLPIAQRLAITWIDRDVAGDTLFPVVDWSEWRLIGSSATVSDAENRFPHRFVDYERRVP